jgi:hypothetical protein
VLAILRKVDPLKRLTGETPSDKYAAAADELTARLIDRPTKPSVRSAAWISYGTLVDGFPGVDAYDEETFTLIGERIVKVWDDCKILVG